MAGFSPNASHLLETASTIAMTRNHPHIGTEHLLYAFCECNSRALNWVAKMSYGTETKEDGNISMQDIVNQLKADLMEWLDRRPIWKDRSEAKGESEGEVPYSPTMSRVLTLARQIGGGPITDKSTETIYQDGLIASEFLLAAVLVEGTGIAVDAFIRFSHGRVNSRSILDAIKVPLSKLDIPTVPGGTWDEFVLQSSNASRDKDPDSNNTSSILELPPAGVSSASIDSVLSSLPPSPTNSSNWLIPNRLIIGEHPSGKEAVNLINLAGVNTFVSLIGEYSSAKYRNDHYPKQIKSMLDSHSDRGQFIRFMHYPIRDFAVTNGAALQPFVAELKKRLVTDSTTVMYIHCRGGHGRTGMVVIPLLSALYDMPVEDIQQYVQKNTARLRDNDKWYPNYVHLPETEEQWRTVVEVQEIVRKHKR